MKMGNESRTEKSYFDVLGLCCSSEIPLIENILKPLDGIQKISVIVASKTVIVLHDPNRISQMQIAKELNKARLEASIRTYGTDKMANKWPSPYILACGILLLISLFQRFYRPLKWLALSAVVIGLPQILLRSLAAIRRYTLDINILMLIAVGGAVALRDYSEAGFIVFLFTMAEWLESIAGQKVSTGMTLLMNLAPQKAVLAETGQVVDAKDVKVDTILAVKAGEVIPIDGIVVEGRSEVDEKSLTGESFPVTKQPESFVWAGTLNIDGYISVKTTALSEHSAVSKMARLVEEAQNNRSKTQRMIDSCAKYYTPAVVIIAAGVALFPIIARAHNQKHWFQLALVLLVSACPCALVLSTPVATFCALLKAARTGLLVKGGDVLEELARTKVMAFDKTGTITTGEFSVVQLRSLSPEITMDMLLSWISSLESKSSHPMASALVDYARIRSIEPKAENVNDFQIYPGEGVSGEINGKKIYIGNKRIAMRAGCARAPDAEDMKEAVTVGYVFLGAMPIGIFSLSDTCRTGAKEAIEELKSLGIKTAMLTGDSTAAARQSQKQLGNIIEEIHAELLPEDKVKIISDLKTKKGSTTMVGDGMNDAPALAMANVGISMGVSGSAVAIETSHVTLMSNDILKIPKAIRLAKRTKQKIIVNIIFSLFTKIGILGLAIGGHPLLWAAVLADVGTCLIVILNSMTLLPTNKKKVKNCCRGSHHQRVVCSDKCSNGSCGPKSVSCHGSHGCHKNRDAEEKKPCCKSKESQPESAAQCCQGKAICRENGREVHFIAMNCEEDSHREDDSCGNHSNRAINHTVPYHKSKGAEEKKPCCKSKERQPESAAQCCQEKAICRENGRDEHFIAMNYEEDSHREGDSCGNHSSRVIEHTVPCHKSTGAEEKKPCCKSKEHQAESATQCCQEKVICSKNGRDEHLIVINCKEDSLRKDDSCGNHSSRTIEHTVPCHELHFHKSKADSEDLISPCIHEEQKEHGSCEGNSSRQTNHGVHSHHESARHEKKSTHRHYEQEINCNLKLNTTKNCCNTCAHQTMGAEANFKASTESNSSEKKNTDNCCEGEGEECHRRHECSNLPASKRREYGGCCRSYRKECSRRETCCGNGMIQVPEIIIE
ncbi:cadmium/zinc-transporting ATPase HMA3-like [Phalaenopsis equestris]|uniref:cadmium/zinc-transporting ATPase HMA3-like n=1 Tax=Phalaenopsis equestris TaxID=78828 RepID=UPI0009E619F5|nr:cadmium/zinc-transporting ATPase HMA3-like [Phalaenopsis equestris]XP_020580569.1 cadmium/zinc-transporting ATPase HMA3-like [Phalaenopsis equestris]XP_020580570.1 cadmium/zinc-transporting ATPase HMA3-like [Phalaenopsis equestris]XP_020580571.1 cadmium/zinc-transporting ATPase HMA3-like [Phalaenopsis equestris]XP_020580572.1 cadmium/zinc-transporting ATPase HMA3-like [Phalaenopsis equestris]XP_020580573.1 cadmium/zinc-transporting ATPase HMA3-like [Phalaenopsis equestris]